MKGKYLIGGFFMAILGAAIALFAYTHLMEKTPASVTSDTSGIDLKNAQAYLTSLQQGQGQIDFTYAADQTVHAVVHVHTKSVLGSDAQNPIMEFFYGRQPNRQREVSGYGSGVIISADGYIITNNHVIEDAETVEVTLNDRRTFNADVIGRDQASDIALLKVKGENLPYIRYGNSDALKLGQWVLAVGNPFNLTSTVTAGIVSAKGRSLGLNEGDYRIESFIQTDAALNMGNSGGALVDTNGNLVGITSAIISPSGAYAGMSFAIPVSIVKKVVDDLKEYGQVQRALIGVNIKDVDYQDAEKLNLKDVNGVLITNVVENGSAEAAGLKENDVIVKFDGADVHSVGELQEQVGKHRPGDKTSVTVLRNGKENTVSMVLKNAEGNTNVVTKDMTVDVVYGARLEPLSSADKKKYDVDYGVKVTNPGDGKFGDIGMPKGFIILSINGKKVSSPADVRKYSENESELKSIGGIQPDGSILNYQFGN
jgi:Do/DeqQ family serine protease